ncbi:hypothetical protein C8R44DRAFT_887067 [Mycena epipterygia]|nr:hypothetical protein C8R44DRAFT_887067 [Mycena epipterygia]
MAYSNQRISHCLPNPDSETSSASRASGFHSGHRIPGFHDTLSTSRPSPRPPIIPRPRPPIERYIRPTDVTIHERRPYRVLLAAPVLLRAGRQTDAVDATLRPRTTFSCPAQDPLETLRCWRSVCTAYIKSWGTFDRRTPTLASGLAKTSHSPVRNIFISSIHGFATAGPSRAKSILRRGSRTPDAAPSLSSPISSIPAPPISTPLHLPAIDAVPPRHRPDS